MNIKTYLNIKNLERAYVKGDTTFMEEKLSDKRAGINVKNSVHTYVHTYIRTYTHAYMHTYLHTCIHKRATADRGLMALGEQRMVGCDSAVNINRYMYVRAQV